MTRRSRLIGILSAMVALTFFLLAMLGLLWFDWNNHKKPSLIDTKTSPDGKYTLQLEQIGEPAFFSAAEARVTLYVTGSATPGEILRFSVSNDGAGLFPENWQVTWETDQAIITVKGLEEPEKSYRLILS